jgi:hypothetical protein
MYIPVPSEVVSKRFLNHLSDIGSAHADVVLKSVLNKVVK